MRKSLLKQAVRGAMNATARVWRPLLRRICTVLSRDVIDAPFASITAQISTISQDMRAAHARLQQSVDELELLAELMTQDVVWMRDALGPAAASRLGEACEAKRSLAELPPSAREMEPSVEGNESENAPATIAAPACEWRAVAKGEAA